MIDVMDVNLNLLEKKICGQPTKSGNPCRNPMSMLPELGIFELSCPLHRTHDIETLSALLRAAYGHGEARGKDSFKYRVNDVRREIKQEFESIPCKHYRTHDTSGRQLVVVELGYTYHWDGEGEVLVGDTVRIPATEWQPVREVKVASLQTDYTGPTRGLLGKV